MKKEEIARIANLVSKVRQKDDDAFTMLYSRMYNKIYFFALTIVKERYLAEDVVQEVFVTVYQSIGSLKNDRLFTAWINQITYRISLSMISKHSEILLEDNVMEQKQVHKEDVTLLAVLDSERKTELMHLILQLPLNFRTVIIMRYYQNCSLNEIAAAMNCPVGTVKSRLNSAKEKLQKGVSRKGILSLSMGGLTISACLMDCSQVYAMGNQMAVQGVSRLSEQLALNMRVDEMLLTRTPTATAAGTKLAAAVLSIAVVGGGTKLTVTAVDSMVVQGSVEIKQIDSVEPEVTSERYDEDTGMIILTVEDDLSGIDIDRTVVIDQWKEPYDSLEVSDGEIRLEAVDGCSELYLYDLAGNCSVYKIYFEK